MATSPAPVPTTQDLCRDICVPCPEDASSLEGPKLDQYLQQLSGPWHSPERTCLEGVFEFDDFREALGFVNEIGELVQAEAHYPDVSLSWGEVRVSLQSSAVDGLSENDFIMAAKIERLYGLGQHGPA